MTWTLTQYLAPVNLRDYNQETLLFVYFFFQINVKKKRVSGFDMFRRSIKDRY